MAHRTLITGGARSGKSSLALRLALTYPTDRAFIATAEAIDAEMEQRIDAHRRERGEQFFTIEEPRDLAGALLGLPATISIAVVDCLTVWLGNLFHQCGDDPAAVRTLVNEQCSRIQSARCDIILVTNEVGWGIIPDNRLARDFRDLAGHVNQTMAAAADTVVLCVTGIPLTIKGEPLR